MVLLWRSKKNKDGGTSRFQPNETKRDISDNDNPITFATGLDDEEQDNFAEQVKNDFNGNETSDTSNDKSDYELAREIMEEADKIGESDISDEDKIVDLYNIYQNYEEALSETQRSILLQKISGLDKMIRLRDKNSKVANSIQNKILSRFHGTKEKEKLESRENKSQRDDSKEPEKESKSPEFKRYSDDDWEERTAMINAMAEM